jgi:M6 family metalloprotease-like protein
MSRFSCFAAATFLGALGLLAATPAPPATLDGQLAILWVDDAGGASAGETYWLHRRGGPTLQLEVAPRLRGAMLRHDRKAVRVRGRDKGPGRFEVADVQAAGGGEAALAATAVGGPLGRQPWVNLLCKFPDVEGQQRDLPFFEAMFSSTRPGLDYYWKEVSNGQFSVAGSRSFGWYTLPQPHSTYVRDGTLEWTLILNDCAALADNDVHFPDYAGINLIFNASLGCCAWGGGAYLARDGVERIYGATWMPDWAWTNHTVFGHEMGHGIGLPHSRGNQQTYRNPWDVMSDIWFSCHLNTDPVLGCLGYHTIAYHKNRLGWVPAAARVTLAPGTTQSVHLDKLERPTAGTHQMAVIPIHGASGHYYTVEARRRYGFDVRLPGASVVIHEVNESLGEPANVVDGDGNGDPYDAGTRWLPGETFSDAANGISVTVDAADGAGFLVTLASTEQPLFADSFESGDVSAWSGGKLDGGDFAVTAAAAMEGAYGAAVTIDDNNQAHVTDHTPAAVRNYLARFRLNPKHLAMANGDRFTVFGAYTDTAYVATIELRFSSGQHELRALARLDDGTALVTPAVYLSPDFPYELQLEWRGASAPGANDGALRFLVNGYLQGDYAGLDTDTLRIERSLLGAVTGVDAGTRGTLYLDAFESRRW